ncbi:hypothetical protein NDU88_003427 [Pleurodeles waltl]|uniref:Uncharacterized protein n=1 Tax=Pleurodeles waltl TaxID=8319 RepID=A0AAV7RFV2_PLEWA|nr:hypothetical protein NDU88_003427 [Pleurodeles waltl]
MPTWEMHRTRTSGSDLEKKQRTLQRTRNAGNEKTQRRRRRRRRSQRDDPITRNTFPLHVTNTRTPEKPS